jgi:hypothetical protein
MQELIAEPATGPSGHLIATNLSMRHPNPYGLISTFKRKFGGVDLAHVPTLDRIYDRTAYARFVDTEGKPVRAIEEDCAVAESLAC